MSLESVYNLSLVMNMIDNLTGPMAGVTTGVGQSVSKLEAMNQTLGSAAMTGAAMAGVGVQITDAVLAPVSATFETRRAIGELASLGIQDLSAIEDAARSFSDEWAGTTKPEFISAAYDIKSGIASLSDEGVARFTALAGLTGKATKSTVAEMTSLFASGYGIYKGYYDDMSDLEFGEMFSAGIAKSVQQFKTTGSGMAQSIQSLGGSATTANVPLEEQLSILGMLQATMSGAEAGTKYKAFLRSAAKGGEELGLSFMDANNQLLSMPEILDILRGRFGETMDAAEKMELQKAFGDSESVALIDLMYSKTGELQSNILGMYDALGSGTGVAKEMASAMNETEPERFDRLQQRLQNVKETIGNSLLPTINDFMSKAEQILTSTGAWIEKNQELVKIIMIAALGLGGFLTVAGTTIAVVSGLGLIFTKTAGLIASFKTISKGLPGLFDTIRLCGMYAGDGIRKGFSLIKGVGAGAVSSIKSVAISVASMAKTAVISGASALKTMALGLVGMAKQAIITATTALPGLIAGVWSFTAALLANPVTWIVIAIIALIAAIVLLWMNWDSVTAWLKTAWDACCKAVGVAINWVVGYFQFMMNIWKTVINGIVSGFNWVKDGIGSIITWIGEKISWFGECGKKIIDTLVGGIVSVAMKPVEAIKGIFQKVRNLLPFSDAKEGPLSTLTLSGQRTMTTYAEGVQNAQNVPSEAVGKSLTKVKTAFEKEPVKKVDFGRSEPADGDKPQSPAASAKDGVYIEKLIMGIDFSKIKELPQLIKLLKEVEDYVNANGGETDTTPEPSPAG